MSQDFASTIEAVAAKADETTRYAVSQAANAHNQSALLLNVVVDMSNTSASRISELTSTVLRQADDQRLSHQQSIARLESSERDARAVSQTALDTIKSLNDREEASSSRIASIPREFSLSLERVVNRPTTIELALPNEVSNLLLSLPQANAKQLALLAEFIRTTQLADEKSRAALSDSVTAIANRSASREAEDDEKRKVVPKLLESLDNYVRAMTTRMNELSASPPRTVVHPSVTRSTSSESTPLRASDPILPNYRTNVDSPEPTRPDPNQVRGRRVVADVRNSAPVAPPPNQVIQPAPTPAMPISRSASRSPSPQVPDQPAPTDRRHVQRSSARERHSQPSPSAARVSPSTSVSTASQSTAQRTEPVSPSPTPSATRSTVVPTSPSTTRTTSIPLDNRASSPKKSLVRSPDDHPNRASSLDPAEKRVHVEPGEVTSAQQAHVDKLNRL